MACEKAVGAAGLPGGGPIGDFGEVRVQPPGRGGAHPRVFPQCPDDAVAGEAAPVDIAPGCAPGEHDGGAVRAEAAGDFVAAPLELELQQKVALILADGMFI